MIQVVTGALCRLFGKGCTVQRPKSKDLVAEMQAHARRAEAGTVEIRRRRGDALHDELFGAPRSAKERQP